jgi:hypothetical protein
MDNHRIIDLHGIPTRETERLEAEERRWFANKIVSTLLRTGILCDVVHDERTRQLSS